MLGIFNKSAAKKEERLLPYFAQEEALKQPGENWVTTQVFKLKGWRNRKHRAYYAACKTREGNWEVSYLIYSLKNKEIQSQYVGSFPNLHGAILKLMEKEKEPGFGDPVPGLEGNYREVVRQSSEVYFDDKGNLKSAKKGVSSKDDVFLTKEKLEKIYNKAEKKKQLEASEISTWDDFYKEIVRKKRLPANKEVSKELHGLISDFNKRLGPEKLSAISTREDLQEAMGNIKGADLAERAGDPNYAVYYHYNVMILTALLRTGGNVYNDFSTSASASQKTIELLADIGSSIENFAQRGLALPPEKAKQLANLIMQGPDPYADKPLPLEARIIAEKAAKKAAAAPKPQTP